MWAWNIQQMGTIDLPALIEHVLTTTRFAKLGLICHSQGTTQTFVALAKHQRPDMGTKISVFCALAPAAYAGPLIDKSYFKFISNLSPLAFKIIFGIHAFIPIMLSMHAKLPAKLYGCLGYRVFWFLFGWSDTRWDRALRDRFFQFAPVYVSAEAMRWWLGRDCFAKHKCILSTKSEEDDAACVGDCGKETPTAAASAAWYDDRCPPMAMWVAGSDDLVDGRRLLERFRAGKEPHVEIVHAKVIDEYEHLDVIWALDAPEKVFKEVVDVLWRCVDDQVKMEVVIPSGVGGSAVL
jgi:pimeloyl-ACP methyl ester carboxylesterase